MMHLLSPKDTAKQKQGNASASRYFWVLRPSWCCLKLSTFPSLRCSHCLHYMQRTTWGFPDSKMISISQSHASEVSRWLGVDDWTNGKKDRNRHTVSTSSFILSRDSTSFEGFPQCFTRPSLCYGKLRTYYLIYVEREEEVLMLMKSADDQNNRIDRSQG